MNKPTKTTLQNFGAVLLHWHTGGGSGIYAVGSNLFAGHEPEPAQIVRAHHELLATRYGALACVTEKKLAAKLQRYFPQAFEESENGNDYEY